MGLTNVDLYRIDGNVGSLSNVQTSALNGGPLAGTRNRIINGDMRIDQRNAGAAVTVNSTSQTFSVDRWFARGIGAAGVFTLQQSSTAPDGFTNSIVATVTTTDTSLAASDRYFLSQRIEANNVGDYGFGTASAKTVTLSFWIRSSVTGTFGGSLMNENQNRSYPFSYSISNFNTWEYKTVTIVGDTTGTWNITGNGAGITLNLALSSGTDYIGTANLWAAANYITATGQTNLMNTNGATFYLAGVQLEAGTVATPFERRSYGQELTLCQRYYEKSYDIDVKPGSNAQVTNWINFAGNLAGYYIFGLSPFKVAKRAAPTIAQYDRAGTLDKQSSKSGWTFTVTDNITAGSIAETTTTAFTMTNSVGSNGNGYGMNWTATAEL